MITLGTPTDGHSRWSKSPGRRPSCALPGPPRWHALRGVVCHVPFARWSWTAALLIASSVAYALLYTGALSTEKGNLLLQDDLSTVTPFASYQSAAIGKAEPIIAQTGQIPSLPPDLAASNRRKGVSFSHIAAPSIPEILPVRRGRRKGPGSYLSPLTIVSAASTNHACELRNLALSVYNASAKWRRRYNRRKYRSAALGVEPRFVAYDLGNNDTDNALFEELRSQGVIQEFWRFNYSAYPPHVNISSHRGHYAWKPLILEDVARRVRTGVVVWMDAGNLVTDPQFFTDIVQNVRSPPSGWAGRSGRSVRAGFWSPRSSDDMGKWTHPGMFAYFGDAKHRHARSPNCNGALLAFDFNDEFVREKLLGPWIRCALSEGCIAPPGSSRENHRQDQSAISFLANANGFRCGGPPGSQAFWGIPTGLALHQDSLCGSPMLEWD